MKLSVVQSEVSERKITLLLCCIAVVHVFIFSAAFPFFSVVDEQAHFDMVTRYAQAAPPRTMPLTSEAALPYIVWFSTSEYLWTPASQPHGMFAPPPWQLSAEDAKIRLAPREKFWRETAVNYEAGQPPLYYLVAGVWWQAGQWLPLADGDRLLWLRLLNMVLLVALVWLGGCAAKKLFPDNRFIRLAVPALIAFFPQSIFYAINSDVMSPLVFGAAFVLLLEFWETGIPGPRHAVATGLVLAATFLTKISNLPLLAVAGVFIAIKFFRLARAGKLPLASLCILLMCAGLPAVAWLMWCKVLFGDFTGTAQKIHFLNWAAQPVAEWFHHPIFTAQGFWFFLKGNLASFWFGEQLWYRAPLVDADAALVMIVLSLGTLILVLAALVRQPPTYSAPQRTALWFGLASIVAAFAFFALLSVKYDFNDCFYPSRAHPFFISGRLMLGLLIPFLILFACGLDQLLKKFPERVKFFVLTALLAFLLTSEITADWPVFFSEYNWFHF